MKRTLLALTLAIASLAAPSQGIRPNTQHCPRDPAGTLVCGARCMYPNSCVPTANLPVGSYCWKANLVDGSPGSCFDGNYDPCCDPNYQW